MRVSELHLINGRLVVTTLVMRIQSRSAYSIK